MQQTPTTQPSLLMRLRDRSDKASWSRFVELYAPVVYGFLRKRGVQDADAADLMQEVMMDVARAVDGFDYDPVRGSFRNWLLTIVQNRLSNFLRRGEVFRGQGGSEATQLISNLPESANGNAGDWETSYERQLFGVAARQIRDDFQEATWTAFWKTAVEGRKPKEVAKQLDLSIAAVYMAKRRVTRRLKEQITFLEGTPNDLDPPMP
jgi:RNA polymerase sigma-70 factor (ECF subfamily)